MSSAVFPSDSEAIIDVNYPSTHDVIDKRFNVLGDDSVLLKYLNHHAVLVATVSPPEAKNDPRICDAPVVASSIDTPPVDGNTSESGSGSVGVGSTGVGVGVECKLYVTLLDTVSAKIIYRIQHDHGAGPVHSTLVENILVYTYWNTKVITLHSQYNNHNSHNSNHRTRHCLVMPYINTLR